MYKYNFITKLIKIVYRKFFPVPKSPWTEGHVSDVCKINLVPPEKLIIFFEKYIYELKKIKGDNIGDYLEFGIFNGNSIGSMFLAMKNSESKFRLFGFDAFEGLPLDSENEDGGVWKKGFYSCSFDQMKKCLQKRAINSDSINWVNGWYKDTLTNEMVNKYEIKNPGIIFIDCDTYSSSKTVLDFIYPMILDKTIVCFDDWKLNDLDLKEMGEYRAFNEFIKEHGDIGVKELKSYNRKSKTFLITKKAKNKK